MPQSLPDLITLSRDDDDLHQVAADAPALQAAIETDGQRLSTVPADDEEAEVASLESYIGEALRILGRHDEALSRQQSATARVVGTSHQRAQVAYALRLAETQRVSGDLPTAERGFRDGLAAARRDPELAVYDDFTLQHLGKCLMNQGRLDQAEVALREALTIRRAKGASVLIASTEAALALVERRRGEAGCP